MRRRTKNSTARTGYRSAFPARTSVERAQAGLQRLATLSPKNLAAGFVPNLISKYLHLITQAERAHLKDYEDRVFNVYAWDYGLK